MKEQPSDSTIPDSSDAQSESSLAGKEGLSNSGQPPEIRGFRIVPLTDRREIGTPRCPGAAPISRLGGPSFCSTHKQDCVYSQTPDALDDLCSPSHSVRPFCTCMTEFDLDKCFVLELYERDLVVDAYHALEMIGKTYGQHVVQSDTDFKEIIRRYDQLLWLYRLLGEINIEGSAALLDNVLRSVERSSDERYLDFSDGDNANDEPNGLAGTQNSPPNGQPPHRRIGKVSQRRSFSGGMSDRNPEEPARKTIHTKWVKLADDGLSCRVWHCTLPDTTQHLVRLEGVVPAPLLDVLSVVAEVDLTPTWVPFFTVPLRMGLRDCKCLLRSGRLDKVSFYQVAMPWPIKDRCVCLHGYFIDDLERNNTLTFGYRSLRRDDPDAPDAPIPPSQIPVGSRGSIAVGFEGGTTVTPLDESTVLVRILCLIDPKEKFNPTIVNFVAGFFMKMGFAAFKKKCVEVAASGAGEAGFVAARRQDPWLYGYVDQRMQELTQFRLSQPPKFLLPVPSLPLESRKTLKGTARRKATRSATLEHSQDFSVVVGS